MRPLPEYPTRLPGAVEVWHDHRLLRSLAPGETYRVEGNDLVIVDAGGVEVQRYPEGTWTGAGVGIVCAYRDDDASCPRCHSPGSP